MKKIITSGPDLTVDNLFDTSCMWSLPNKPGAGSRQCRQKDNMFRCFC